MSNRALDTLGLLIAIILVGAGWLITVWDTRHPQQKRRRPGCFFGDRADGR